MKIDDFQHPDSIWTWKSNRRGARCSLWLPYLQTIEKQKGLTYRFTYNGGELDADLKKLDCIMIYGPSGALPVTFIDDAAQNRIPILIHRRNISSPVTIFPAVKSDSADILSRQIKARDHDVKRCYIARTLVTGRCRTVATMLPVPENSFANLRKRRSIKDIRLRGFKSQVQPVG